MKAGKYTIKDFFLNRYVHQIIIPEIQRDYVWEEEQVLALMDSIENDYRRYLQMQIPVISSEDKQLEDDFRKYYRKRYCSSNIGFIYAYTDNQISGKYFLIDGQQRITTIYLILLALASDANTLRERFSGTYKTEDSLKLDYKVRESAHNFISEFASHLLIGKDDFENQNWYFESIYNADKTIVNLLNNYKSIKTRISVNSIELREQFYDYVENFVEFWYFDTNISQQGEELYIYMNARGEQMEENESIKADLLGKLSDLSEKNIYGKKWEGWQDFFWTKRGKNENADRGFNQFLTCVAGLELYLRNDKSRFYSKERFDREKKVKASEILKVLNINKIETYFKTLYQLDKYKEVFKNKRKYYSWVDQAFIKFWSLLNDLDINWFADYDDDNRATERNAMVYVWSLIHFLSQKTLTDENVEEVFRIVRFYYLRHQNFIRSVNNIRNNVSALLQEGPWTIKMDGISKEEAFKSTVLSTTNVNNLKEIEEFIWQIEDHPFNLNGRDVGNINLIHLIHQEEDVTICYLKKVKKKFWELFPYTDNPNETLLRHILLYYGVYYDRVSPYYYENYKFNNWRRIIRGLSTESSTDKSFSDFFNDFVTFEGSLQEFKILKDQLILEKSSNLSFREKLLWYSRKLGPDMWSQGPNIARSHGSFCGLPDWENQDQNFNEDYIYYNIKGNLKGGTPIEISKQLFINHA